MIKKEILIKGFCALTLALNGVTGFAQDKTAPADAKTKTTVFVGQDGKTIQAPEGGSWVSADGDGQNMRFSFATGDQDHKSTVEFVSSEFSFDSKIVKGMPYSADAVTETIQTLGDGNRIIRSSSAKLYRDSEGRTRREQSLRNVGPWAVTDGVPSTVSINDPVAGAHYTLNQNNKTARKLNVRTVNISEHHDKASSGDHIEKKVRVTARGQGSDSSTFTFVTDGQNVSVSESGTATAVAAGPGQKEMVFIREGNVITSGEGEVQAKRESLGKQSFEGIEAEGTRSTITIPAGKVGNERPIEIVTERWYSPELQTLVMSRTSDPRTGETTYKLVNISRAEPDPALFQIPYDYTVDEGIQRSNFIRKVESKAKKRENEN